MRVNHKLWLVSSGRDKARLIQPGEGSGYVREALHWGIHRAEPMSKVGSENRYTSELRPLSRYQCGDTLAGEESLKYISYVHPCIPFAFSFTFYLGGWAFVIHSSDNSNRQTPDQHDKPSSPT